MLRLSIFPAVACVLSGALWAQSAPPHPTAVFTLDTRQQTFIAEPGSPVAVRFAEWALECETEPRGELYVLRCPAREPQGRGASREDPANEVTVSLALFRDLKETLYLAGCPALEELSEDLEPRSRPRSRQAEPPGPEEQADKTREQQHRECLEVAAGQTFSTEVDGRILKIVLKGRQLPFTVFGMRPKARSTGSPYEPAPSRKAPSIGAPKAADSMGMRRQTEPEWHPPDLSALSGRAASLGAPGGAAGAKTSLRTGRFTVTCSSTAHVYVDGTYVGVCPIDMPLLAGPHLVEVKSQGERSVSREFRIDAGEIVRLTIRGGTVSLR